MSILTSIRRSFRPQSIFQSQGLRPAIIEKDYYVTEGPCIIAASGGRLSEKITGAAENTWEIYCKQPL